MNAPRSQDRLYPALEIRLTGAVDSELVAVMLDDFQPTALEEHEDVIRAFFPTNAARDRASASLGSQFEATPLNVADENWAERSQQDLRPVTVGRITVAPPWVAPSLPLWIVVRPSMGFGTGHHATTRLCLAALQAVDLTGACVLDAGTGSGVLAIAADLLGASSTVGIDSDPDAIQSALETATLNPGARHTRFEIADLRSTPLPVSDVISANLTGALLERAAVPLLNALTSNGRLIISGFQIDDRDSVVRQFQPLQVSWEQEEEGWIGMILEIR